MSRDYLFDLRARMLKSAANVSNSPRLMERLVAALTELQSMKKVSSILQTCATLGKNFLYLLCQKFLVLIQIFVIWLRYVFEFFLNRDVNDLIPYLH